jgi:hypothetical protein
MLSRVPHHARRCLLASLPPSAPISPRRTYTSTIPQPRRSLGHGEDWSALGEHGEFSSISPAELERQRRRDPEFLADEELDRIIRPTPGLQPGDEGWEDGW